MKKHLVLLILLLQASLVPAQTQIIYESNEAKSWLLTYLPGTGEESQRVINEMLEVVANALPRPINQTKATFTVNENIRITRSQQTVTIFVSYSGLVLSGDVFYRGFDFTDMMIPSKYEFSGTLYRENNQLLASYNQARTAFTPPYSEARFQYTDTAVVSKYRFVVNPVLFYFDNQGRDRFRGKVQQVDQYYQAEIDLRNAHTRMDAIHPELFEQLSNASGQLQDIKRTLDQIGGAPFWQALNIAVFDPLHLGGQQAEALRRWQDLKGQVDAAQAVLHISWYNKGVTLYNSGKKTEARPCFEQALILQPNYSPAQLYLARCDYDAGQYETAKQAMKRLFTMPDIDENTRRSALALCDVLEWTDLNVAAQQLSNGKFTEALASAQKAEDFCKSIPAYTCNDTIELIRRDSYNGLYRAALQQADQLYRSKAYAEADSKADEAIAVQQQHPTYVADAKAALALKEKIKAGQYDVAVKGGREKLKSGDYRAAFDLLALARDIESVWTVKKDPQLASLLRSAKLEVILLDLDEAEKSVKANNLSVARQQLLSAIEDQKAYQLIGEQRLNTRLEALKRSIFRQECANAQAEYDNHLASAQRHIAANDFIAAEESYTVAQQTAANNSDCGIATDAALAGQQKMADPAAYQRGIKQVSALISCEQYENAIREYIKLGEFFEVRSLAGFGLAHLPLHQFMTTKRYEFPLYGITWELSNNQPNEAFFLLQHLRKINLHPKFTKMQQAALARALALRDYKSEPGMNVKLRVAEYTLGDKWYNVFKKEYLKQIKAIR